jgi:hypothetical protein
MQRKSMLSAAPGEGSMLYDDADMDRAGRFDSLGMTAEDAGENENVSQAASIQAHWQEPHVHDIHHCGMLSCSQMTDECTAGGAIGVESGGCLSEI